MNFERLGRICRLVRVRQRMTQAMVAARAGVTRATVSHVERGRAGAVRLDALEAIMSALGARIDLRVMWRGPELDRLLDAGHAALAGAIKRRL
jgi:transcriptional regulator with XRE-family HTH domain